MTWLPLLIIAGCLMFAGSLLAIKLTPHGRFVCAACLDKFETEAALTAHIERAHGYCTALYGYHPCRLPADGHLTHRCGPCGLEWE
jgi:hypothetical protein